MSDQENAIPQPGAGDIPESDVEAGASTSFHPTEALIAPVDQIDPAGLPLETPQEEPGPEASPVKAVDKAEDEQEDFNFPTPVARNNATQEIPYSSPLTGEWDELSTSVILPADTAARTMNYIDTVPNSKIDGAAGMETWTEALMGGLKHNALHDNQQPAASREGADYRQRVMHGEMPLSIAKPRIKDDDQPLLSGERGVLRIKALLGHGALVQIPLWHTGCWITLKTPGEVELLDAYQRIIDNKIQMGRFTNGYAFANHSVFDNAVVVDLAMKCLYETSIAGVNALADLRKLIKAPDIHMLAWGLACAIWPRGFQYERSVLDPHGNATVTVRENLNVAALLWVDQSSLSPWQISHMAKRQTGSMSVESLKTYNEHFVRGQPKVMKLTDELHITGRVPSIEEYLTSGQQWIDELVAAVNESFTEEDNVVRRNQLINDRARATSMRQYAHWIKSFDVPGINKQMTGRDEIESTCSEISSDNVIRDTYYRTMREYINDSTIALVAVPQTHPNEASAVLPRFENLVPLDPISVFFTLLFQKIAQIKGRP